MAASCVVCVLNEVIIPELKIVMNANMRCRYLAIFRLFVALTNQSIRTIDLSLRFCYAIFWTKYDWFHSVEACNFRVSLFIFKGFPFLCVCTFFFLFVIILFCFGWGKLRQRQTHQFVSDSVEDPRKWTR